MTIWFTSDWHFNHNREFVWKVRGFENVQEMNEEIIRRHNEVVRPDDDVYILGDLCLGGGSEDTLMVNKGLIERMNGKLHIIIGNHDTEKRQWMYSTCDNVKEILYASMLKYKKYHFYLSHYPTITSNLDDNDSLKRRVLNLYGHTHQTTKFYNESPIMYNVGVDAHNCYPVSIDTIIEEMEGAY